MTTTPDTLPRADVLAAVRTAWDEATREKHGNPIIALTTVLRVLGMGEHVAIKDGRAVLANEPTRTPETMLRATLSRLRDAINNPPDGDDNDWKSAMRAALREHEAALAGTAPVDAPPRKPDR